MAVGDLPYHCQLITTMQDGVAGLVPMDSAATAQETGNMVARSRLGMACAGWTVTALGPVRDPHRLTAVADVLIGSH